MPQDPRPGAPRATPARPPLRLVADSDPDAPADPGFDHLVGLLKAALRQQRDWPFPLHSPLPPAGPQGDEPLGLGKGHLPSRCTLALRALALMARRKADDRLGRAEAPAPVPAGGQARGDGDEGGRRVGLPTAEVLASLLEWWARRPALAEAAGAADQRHVALLQAFHALAAEDASLDFTDAATAWMADALPRAFQRDAAQQVDIDGLQAAAAAVARSHPRTARKLRGDADKQRLKLLSSRLFGQAADAWPQATAGGAPLLCSAPEVAATQALLQQPAGRRALLRRLLTKLLRAHLGHAAPGPGEQPHALEQAALGLLPVVVAHGAPACRALAAQLLLAPAAQAGLPSEANLPRCFRVETLQSPQDLADQARFALLGASPQPDDPLAGTLDTLVALTRDLARAVTDPMRARALGFTPEQFAAWQQQLDDDLRPSRLPRRLKLAGDDGTASYLALDLLPRMARWKDQHSVMARDGASAFAAVIEVHPHEATLASVGLPQLTVLAGKRRPRTGSDNR